MTLTTSLTSPYFTLIYVVPALTPFTTPSVTVAVKESSDVITQSFASIETLLYNPPLIPMILSFFSSLTAISITAGVTAKSFTATVEAILGISVI